MSAPTDAALDASRKFYRVKVKAEVFEIDVRYTDLVYIASGAYGNVVSAVDNVRKGDVPHAQIPRRVPPVTLPRLSAVCGSGAGVHA